MKFIEKSLDKLKAKLLSQPIAWKRTVEEVFGNVSGKVVYHEDVSTPTADEWREV